MATFYLIRHGNNDWIGKTIAGWMPGVHLNQEGRKQAEALGRKLSGRGIARIVSSPLERAAETAAPIAAALGLDIETSDALGEIRFGEWTGKPIPELDRDPEWRRFCAYRSGTRAPGGETMLETQLRIVRELDCLRQQSPDSVIAVVSHADTIRAALLHYLGMPIDLYARIEIRPASFSIV